MVMDNEDIIIEMDDTEEDTSKDIGSNQQKHLVMIPWRLSSKEQYAKERLSCS